MSHTTGSDHTLDDLLGAFALDALDADEAAAVERYLEDHPEAAAEAARLRSAAAWIGASEALAPPAGLRDDLLATARARVATAVDGPLAAYLGEAERFEALVATLSGDDMLDRPTANGLCVRELVIHLAAMESLLAHTLGEPTEPVIEETDIERRTELFVERFRSRPLDDARACLHRSVEAVRRWAEHDENADADVACFGLLFTRDNLLVTRAFETWTHADDIRRALARPAAPPEPAVLHRMADLSVSVLPIALEVTGRAHRGKSARVVLTGPGGGSWLLALGRGEPAEPPDAVMTVDTIDWCLVVAERIAPEELRYEFEGDQELVRDLAASASAFTKL
jgi:uncharacterized protein (TIGR03083 family)